MMMGVAQVMGMKPTLRSFFSGAPPWAKALARHGQGQDRGDGGHRRGGADRLQEQAALGIDREDRAQDGGVDHPVPALLLGRRHRFGHQARMVGRSMVAAAAAAPSQRDPGIERILEHREASSLLAPRARLGHFGCKAGASGLSTPFASEGSAR